MAFFKGKPRPTNAGRRKGTPNKATERARRLISAADDKAIIEKVVADAKVGEPEALRIYFRFLRPPLPRFLGPIDYVAARTPEAARAALLELSERLAQGAIAIELHDALVNDIKVYLADRAVEQEERLVRIEDILRSRADKVP